jgi:Methyltransferase FkbM domain
MIGFLRKILRNNSTLREIVAFRLAPSGFFDFYFKSYTLSEHWKKRVEDVFNCPETHLISTVFDAGKIENGKQIMHNGIKIHLGSYYGPEYAKLFQLTKGIHEPEEEFIFSGILEKIPNNGTMIELGSFWSFYSMWFNSKVINANNYMIEPDPFNIKCGQRNFELNNMKGDFTLAFIGKESKDSSGFKSVCIDNFVKEKNINKIDILHSDIQGYEHEMLQGCSFVLKNNLVNYVFISSHSNDVHYKCVEFLKINNFDILKSIDIDQTHSEDGLIVAKSLNFNNHND